MQAVGVVFWAQLRHRWRSWLAIVILISLVGGVVLATVAAGRRTDSAFPRFVASHGFDAEIYSAHSAQNVSQLPGVIDVTGASGPYNGRPSCTCTHPLTASGFGVLVMPQRSRSTFALVSGRLPVASNPREVLASYTLQKDEGVHLGSIIHVPFYAPSQASAYSDATGAPPKPMGPTVAFRVVGFEATEVDFPYGAAPNYLLFASQAFAREMAPRTITGFAYFVRLRHGAADLPRFSAAASALGSTVFTENADSQVASVEASIRPQALGWWLLAALAALVGLAVIGQALDRQSIAESEDFPTMVAIGLGRRQLRWLGNLRNLFTGLAGAAGAVVLATLLSPIAPLGEARVAEGSSSDGIAFDALVLLLGGVAVAVAVVVVGLWPSARAARKVRTTDQVAEVTSSKIAGHIWSLGAPLSVVIGVRNALERRTGRASVPVGSALLGTILAVVALCGTAVFGTSLTNLTNTPKLYGDPFQLNISNPNGGTPDPELLSSVKHDRDVSRVTQGIALPAISINKVVVGAVAGTPIRGDMLFSTVHGHPPNAPGQVGLGATTMRQTGAHVGSIVQVAVLSPSGTRRTVPFRVVAEVSLPVLGNAISLGTGALFTLAGYEDAACSPSPMREACRVNVAESTNGGMLVSFVPGARGTVAVNRYLNRYPSLAALAITPTSLINFGEAVNFPLLFGAVLAIFGAATLLHLLMVSVNRRRRDVGLLKIVGFVNLQVGSTVAWQAATVALAGIAIGVPLGVVVGRVTWQAFATDLGAVPVSVVPIDLILLLSVSALIVAVLLSVAPALVAIRARPRDLLRTS